MELRIIRETKDLELKYVSTWFEALQVITRAEEGSLYLTSEGSFNDYWGLDEDAFFRNYGKIVFHFVYNKETFFVGIQGDSTIDELGNYPAERLSELLCKNKKFLRAVGLGCLEIDGEKVFEHRRPRFCLIDRQLETF